MVLCVNRLYPPVLAPRTSQSLWVRNPTTGMLFWSDLQKPIFYILQTMATGTYHTLLERSGWGDCSAVGIVGNGSEVVEKFWKQVWQVRISGGELILEVCLGLSVVWIATYSYLRCCHRLCEKGDRSFIWKSMQRIQESQVNIRLPLISFISFLPHIGFWSNLGPTESCFQGESNAT